MQREIISWEDLGVKAEYSLYIPEKSGASEGVSEYHVMLHVEPRGELFEAQLERIYQAELRLLGQEKLEGAEIVLKRYFLTDAANQQPVIEAHRSRTGTDNRIYDSSIAISMIQQPLLDGSKVAIWLYLVKGAEKVYRKNNFTVVESHDYKHLYQWGLIEPKGDSYQQTQSLLEKYETSLEEMGAHIAQNCIRTWFYVRDVDTQYAGMVKARKENFAEQGLTEKTHYIASTGIGGVPANQQAIVQLGTYALLGFEPAQQQYLYASTHLNPTYEYGVTFERGVKMEYGDRAHLYISGTASINNKGEVLFVGDIDRQTDRMIENVEVLLAEGQASFDDVMQMVVYLRDMADAPLVKAKLDARFPDIPKVLTLAPVCRPTWLVEMECIAVAQRNNSKYRIF
ncbi:MAG: Rid family hydrolase [Bacteroidales bacterium]|nr:Rid family hydrolase [Bacteroidales bacterium]